MMCHTDQGATGTLRENIECALLAELRRQHDAGRLVTIALTHSSRANRGADVELEGWIHLGEMADAIVQAVERTVK